MRKRRPEVGVYALLLHVPRKTTIAVGRLGSLEFVPGVYVYIGSALNSLPGRVARHFRQAKRTHWHIDYLVGDPSVRLLSFAVRPTSRKIECAMSRAIQRSAVISTDRFGSSDCNCDSHLHRFAKFLDASEVLCQHRFQFRPRGDLG
ncbi:MAG TPA: GIY-YIG nuclease family protein [Candidatus Bathyarchaeia archaeon]